MTGRTAPARKKYVRAGKRVSAHRRTKMSLEQTIIPLAGGEQCLRANQAPLDTWMSDNKAKDVGNQTRTRIDAEEKSRVPAQIKLVTNE